MYLTNGQLFGKSELESFSAGPPFIRSNGRKLLMEAKHRVELNNGVKMPMIGIGTWQLRDPQVLLEVLDAGLDAGYRLIDTAASYQNEELIADALSVLLPKYSLMREDIFITSKLDTKDQGKGKATKAALASLKALRTPYIDLYLIHWPGMAKLKTKDPGNSVARQESWTELEKLYEEERFRAIGVSNYLIRHLEELSKHAKHTPAVNQCEFHPHYATMDLVQYCRDHQIHFQAYSSFGSPQGVEKVVSDPQVQLIAAKYETTPHQILLAWPMAMGISVLPRSSKPERVKDNLKARNITLEPDDIDRLIKCKENAKKYSWDPETVL